MSLLTFDVLRCALIEQFAVVLGDLGFDESDLGFGQSVPLIKLGVRPLSGRWQIWDETVNILRCVLGGLTQRDKKASEACTQIGRVMLSLVFVVEEAGNDVTLGASGTRLGDERPAKELGLNCRAGALYASHQDLPLVDPRGVGRYRSALNPANLL